MPPLPHPLALLRRRKTQTTQKSLRKRLRVAFNLLLLMSVVYWTAHKVTLLSPRSQQHHDPKAAATEKSWAALHPWSWTLPDVIGVNRQNDERAKLRQRDWLQKKRLGEQKRGKMQFQEKQENGEGNQEGEGEGKQYELVRLDDALEAPVDVPPSLEEEKGKMVYVEVQTSEGSELDIAKGRNVLKIEEKEEVSSELRRSV
ncbi:hypothetical protein QBC35DRAFT_549283 [Podospora australis]|uniref:Uncharacterized protein n=1 Tax=Podospora australis TaxID=1536484 RepID=A0AAN6WUD8_9PEZI|nr:hypothetical protein QBC35DRAFT_549283 [Podospora australis]